MESRRKKTTFVLLFLAFALFAAIALSGMRTEIASAQNSNVKIELNAESLFDADGDVLAYTNGTNLYAACDDKLLCLADAYAGVAAAICVSGTDILVLSESTSLGGTKSRALNFYRLAAGAIVALAEAPNDWDYDFGKVLGLYAAEDGAIYLCDGAQILRMDLTSRKLTAVFISKNDIFQFTDFAVTGTEETLTLYAIDGQNLYAVRRRTLIDAPDPSEFILSAGAYASLAVSQSKLWLNGAGGVFLVKDNAPVKVMDSPDAKGALACADIADTRYLFILCASDLSVKQYVISGETLQYVNSFDKEEYAHPSSYEILRVAAVGERVQAVVSPKNRQTAFVATQGDYILLLSERDAYYYVVNAAGEKGYLPKNAPLSRIEPKTRCAIGATAQALHPNTVVSQYPYTGSAELGVVDLYKRLTVLDDVASSDTLHVWNWYHVAYVDDSGVARTGYVRGDAVSPYVELKAPAARLTAKIKTKQLGTISKLFKLPDETSEQLSEMTDGTEITLADGYRADAEWTAVLLGDVFGYVRTEEIQIGGLTAVQITVITVVCVVAAASAAAAGILLWRRRKSR